MSGLAGNNPAPCHEKNTPIPQLFIIFDILAAFWKMQ
jgi:hypothetical protein